MKNRKGFTLLELLIAATILGLLAALAAVSYRSTSVEARMTAAKVKTEQLADAQRRFELDHGTRFGGKMGNLTNSSIECHPTADFPKTLITCDYVDNGGWTDSTVVFYTCRPGVSACQNTNLANPLACMKGRNRDTLPAKYRGVCGYSYCVSATGKEEIMGLSGRCSVEPGAIDPEEAEDANDPVS